LQHGVRRTFFGGHLVPLRRRAGSGGQDYRTGPWGPFSIKVCARC
jgi:hypothetical protein